MRWGFICGLLTVAQCFPSIAHAWDHAGHMLVGQIAWEKCTPEVRERITNLAALLPRQHNKEQPYNFITVGCWMDDMRSEPDYAWSNWHYINERWTPDGSAFQIPEPPHIVWAIEETRAKLRDAASHSPEQQAEAVAMLVHFVGDVHQPMHATERNDRGGNGFFVMGVPISTLNPRRPANLHFFWDAAFRLARVEGESVELWQQPEIPGRPKKPAEGVIGAEAVKLMQRFPMEGMEELKAPLSGEQWARESHLLGCQFGYPEGAEPSDTEIHSLTPEFVDRSQAIAGRRVALAGYRLGVVLNDLFSGNK